MPNVVVEFQNEEMRMGTELGGPIAIILVLLPPLTDLGGIARRMAGKRILRKVPAPSKDGGNSPPVFQGSG